MVKEYKYHLDKSSKKFICPSCKEKRFVRYIDIDTKEYLPEQFGRCDREINCGLHNYPKKEGFLFPTPKRKETGNHNPVSYLPFGLLDKSVLKHSKCNLFPYLKELFSEEIASRLCLDYFIGTNKWENTVFWRVDINGNVREGKVIKYDPVTGRRNKETRPYYIGKKILGDESNPQQCFFGEYLLADEDSKNKPVGIVESEKTAAIASIFKPDILWLATGGKFGCKWTEESVCKVLAGRTVILFPDLGAYDAWEEKGKLLAAVAGCKVGISDFLEKYANEEERKQGLDIADYFDFSRQILDD